MDPERDVPRRSSRSLAVMLTVAALPGLPSPPEARDELRPFCCADDFKRFERFGSYNGYRVGITAGDDWTFFVSGD